MLAVSAAAGASVAQGRITGEELAYVAPPAAPRAELVEYAKRFLGTPYRWSGSGPGGFDCSGFTRYVYGHFGVSMAHYTGAQFAAYRKVPRGDLQPGDLVFFDGVGHTGIYVGAGRFIHATHSGDVVRVSKLNGDWYGSRYSGAVRPPFPIAAASTRSPLTIRPEGIFPASSSGSSA